MMKTQNLLCSLSALTILCSFARAYQISVPTSLKSSFTIFSTASGDTATTEASFGAFSQKFLQKQASLLRKEAEELELSLREEARAKGLPEEMINKLIPLRSLSSSQRDSPSQVVDEREEEDPGSPVVERIDLSLSDLREKINDLQIGDAISFSSSLNRLKASALIRLWDSFDLSSQRFSATVNDLKRKTSIDPVNLRLDDIGFNYQNVLVAAVLIGTASALISSFIGGQIGFFLGYLSVLFPILVVGVGSVAPSLIGEVLLQIQLRINRETRDRFIAMNAGKFLVGYLLGLPLLSFKQGDVSNTVEFFQLKPSSSKKPKQGRDSDVEREGQRPKRMFSKISYAQDEVAASTVACIAGSVAECLQFGRASGSNAVDVNIMYELLSSVEPSLPPEKIQDHLRWAAITARDLLHNHKTVYQRLVEAFNERLPLEECIAIMETTKKTG